MIPEMCSIAMCTSSMTTSNDDDDDVVDETLDMMQANAQTAGNDVRRD